MEVVPEPVTSEVKFFSAWLKLFWATTELPSWLQPPVDLADVLLSSSGHPIPLSLLNVFRGNPRDSFETLGGVFQCILEVGWI